MSVCVRAPCLCVCNIYLPNSCRYPSVGKRKMTKYMDKKRMFTEKVCERQNAHRETAEIWKNNKRSEVNRDGW